MNALMLGHIVSSSQKALTQKIKLPPCVVTTALPCMVQFAMIKTPRFWNAEGSPHSGGRVPDRKFCPEMPAPICSCCKAGKEAPPQEGGKVPDRLVSSKVTRDKFGNAPGLPHDVGKVPVAIHKSQQMMFPVWGIHQWSQQSMTGQSTCAPCPKPSHNRALECEDRNDDNN